MAKPKKKPEAATTTLAIDLTDAERQEVERLAREAGLEVPAYVKSRILALDPVLKSEIDAWEAASDEAMENVDRLLE